MGFSDTPIAHIPLIILGWISAVVYVLMLTVIYKDRRTLFRNSYIPLFVAHSVADCLLFLQSEFISRPKKYNWFGIFNEDMTAFAKFTFFYGCTVRYVLYLGHVVSAFNRFTVVRFPLVHDQIWSPQVICLFVFSCWWSALLFVVPNFIFNSKDIRFELQPDGELSLEGGKFIANDSFYGSFVTYAALIVCIFFYGYSFFKLPKFIFLKNPKVERRILICAMFSFFPFLLGSLRKMLAIVGSYTKNPQLWIISDELWYYDTELNFCAQVWINLLMLKQVKKGVVGMIFKGKAAGNNQSSTNRPNMVKSTSTPSGLGHTGNTA